MGVEASYTIFALLFFGEKIDLIILHQTSTKSGQGLSSNTTLQLMAGRRVIVCTKPQLMARVKVHK